MPWLMKEVKKEMGNMIESRELLMGKCCPRDANVIRNSSSRVERRCSKGPRCTPASLFRHGERDFRLQRCQ